MPFPPLPPPKYPMPLKGKYFKATCIKSGIIESKSTCEVGQECGQIQKCTVAFLE